MARGLHQHHVQRDPVSKNEEFCVKNEEFCIKNKELCTKTDEFCRCASTPTNPSNKCCAACLAAKTCGTTAGSCLTNTTQYDSEFKRYASPDKDANGQKLYGYKTMPASKEEAYEQYRDYYNSRIAWISSVGDQPYSSLAQINSITCVSHMELYAVSTRAIPATS